MKHQLLGLEGSHVFPKPSEVSHRTQEFVWLSVNVFQELTFILTFEESQRFVFPRDIYLLISNFFPCPYFKPFCQVGECSFIC